MMCATTTIFGFYAGESYMIGRQTKNEGLFYNRKKIIILNECDIAGGQTTNSAINTMSNKFLTVERKQSATKC